MIICGNCQFRNPDEKIFCDSCGDYLMWSGVSVPDPVATVAPQPAAEVAPQPTAEAAAEPQVEPTPEPAPEPVLTPAEPVDRPRRSRAREQAPRPPPPEPPPQAPTRTRTPPRADALPARSQPAGWYQARPRPQPRPAPPAHPGPAVEVIEEPEDAPVVEPESEPAPEPGVFVADDKGDEIVVVREVDEVPFFPGDERQPVAHVVDEEDEDEEELDEEGDAVADGWSFRRLVDDAGRRRDGLPPLPPARPAGLRPRPRARTGASRPRQAPPATTATAPPTARAGPSAPPRLPGRSRVGMATPAGPLLRPGTDEEAVLRLPGEAAARTALRPSEDEPVVARPGDIACPNCRTANSPERHFCLRCGQPLHVDLPAPGEDGPLEDAPRRRWWQRILRRRAPEQPWSDPLSLTDVPVPGQAAKLMAGAKEPWRAKVKRVGPIALAVLGVLTVLGPMRRPIVRTLESARKVVVPRFERIHPEKAEATSSVPDHGPELAVDNAPNTYWAEGAPTRGDGEILYITFETGVDIGRIGITPGAQTKPQDFLSQPRPRDIVITFDGTDPQRVQLKDKPAFQSFDVDAEDVRVVAIRISSVYLSPLGGTASAIGEVEFFVKK